MKEEQILTNVAERFVFCPGGILRFRRLYIYSYFVLIRSQQFFSFFDDLRKNSRHGDLIVDVRGKGLMVAVEFASPSRPLTLQNVQGSPPPNLASKVAAKCLERGLLLLTTSAFEVIRFIPPLVATKDELQQGLDIFKEAFEDVASARV
jgi:4-aminobutyrate aminotransferase